MDVFTFAPSSMSFSTRGLMPYAHAMCSGVHWLLNVPGPANVFTSILFPRRVVSSIKASPACTVRKLMQHVCNAVHPASFTCVGSSK